MASKNIYLTLIIRVVFITLTSLGFAFFVMNKQFDYAIFMLFILLIQVLVLIRYLNKINRRIAYFFNAVENEDSTIHFPEKIGLKSIKELNISLNRVNHLIQKVKIENQTQEQYFHTILDQAAIGILTINDKGHILFANSTVKKILNYETLTHVQQLKKIDDKLFSLISNLNPFEQKLLQIPNERESVELTVKASSLTINGEELMLVLIQNIHNELDAKEVDSWIGLIRVLTHEIMNSIAPITSLSETLAKIFKKDGALISVKNLQVKDIAITAKGLDIIQSQGNDLINFVSSYRLLTKIPKPDKVLLSVQEIFEKIRILVSQEPGFDKIKFELLTTPENLEVFADENQLVQVLVNLVKNAIQALGNQPDGLVKMNGNQDEFGKVLLNVTDNGPGIPKELIDQIFIPFFTTREKGTGIGLSLSKHIMRLHSGNLKVQSVPNKETRFILSF